ncbi:hypothetical protein [Haliangium sp.]|uniref:hypothetical protein n=1 Tax=Haliangium sp. TaxID=2663208 RepID=UPI003D122AF1
MLKTRLVYSLLLAAVLVTGCGDDGQSTPDAQLMPDAQTSCTPDLGDPDPADGDVNGSWALFTRFYANVQGLSGAQISRSLYLHEVSQNGADLTVTETLCDLRVDAEDGSVELRVGPAFIGTQPPASRTGTITAQGDSFAYALDTHYAVRGAILEDEINDPLPTDANDPSVDDRDGDGNPGVTLFLSGILSGQLFVVQRDSTMFAGTQVSAERIEGLAVWSAEIEYLGADPAVLLDLINESQPDPNPDLHTFQLVRVPAGSDCAYVIENRCDLFFDEN